MAHVSCNEYVLKGSMIHPPPPPIKPQDVLSRRGVSRVKNKEYASEILQSPTARPPDKRAKRRDHEDDDSRHGRRDNHRRPPPPPSGCTNMLLSLLGCQGSRTVDSALVPIAGKRRDHGPDGRRPGHDNFRKTQGNGGVRSGREEKVSSLGKKCKPARSPNCSQCGKQFNPEKLHSHMKSCKAMAARAKGRRNFDQTPSRTGSNRTTEPSSQEFSRESIAGLLM